MKKISKKIVSLVTLAAFALTLVPAAAFAAPVTDPLSSVEFTSEEETITVKPDEGAELDITLSVGTQDANKAPIYVWLTKDDSTAIYRGATYTGEVENNNLSQGELKNAALVTKAIANTAETLDITATVKEVGTYTVHAGIANSTGDKNDRGDLQIFDSVDTITVVEPDSTVTKIDSEDATYTGTPDGVAVGVVNHEATVYGRYDGSEDDVALSGKEVTITAPAGFTVTGKDVKDGKATTNDEGKITFSLIADKTIVTGTYSIDLECEGFHKFITVTVKGDEDTVARTIEAVDTGKDTVINTAENLSSVAQFVFKNANGDVVDVTPSSQTSTRILQKADAYKGEFEVIAVPNNTEKHYTLKPTKTLATGDYEVRVALTGKDSIDLTFTVDRFGKVVDSKIVVTEIGSTEPVTNVYEDGTEYTGTIYQVDENGLERVAESGDLIAGILKGQSAVKSFNGGTAQNGTFTFTVEDDSVDGAHDNALVGTDIVFMAYSKSAAVNAQATVTVADIANTQAVELAFDSEAGEAGKYNTVNVTLVDANGNVVENVDANGNNVSASVVSQSVEDANVQASMGAVENGKAELKVYANKETTADILVVVKDTTNKVMYANTLTYAFGEQDIPVDTTVVMTIGSSDFVVNNDVITMEDGAPYVANNRTYVPFRALGEALGAEVVWDNDARTVTYTLGKTEVVMTIGETTYTINGEEKTMDVAPEITGDRTYVPVRFVGEAFGFSVTALSNTDGTTASVVFQK